MRTREDRTGRPRPRTVRRAARTLALLAALALAAAPSLAQTAEDRSDAQAEVEAPVPALAAFGVSAGFPSNRTVTATASLQAGFVGMAVHAGYGPGAGGYGGGTVRLYPPVPGLPVPVWVGGGAGVGVGGVVPHAAVGAHVPLAQRLRLDVEAGAAWPSLGPDRRVVPQVALGVSYAFAVELTPARTDAGGAGPGPSARTGGSTCSPAAPDPGGLDAALRRAEDDFVGDARATYGSLYRDLRYRLVVADRTLDGDRATLDLEYDGSVVEIATGERIAASGEATASFRWDGCDWRLAGLDY